MSITPTGQVSLTDDQMETIHASLYLCNKSERKYTYGQIFKLLFFAELYHLKNFAKPSIGDTFYKLKLGPVPTWLYDAFKCIADKPHTHSIQDEEVSKYFDVKGSVVTPKMKYDPDELSPSQMKSLDFVFKEYGHLSFDEMIEESHRSAWDKSEDFSPISYELIVEEAQLSEPMAQYYKENNPSEIAG